jgi:hypothetical protein
MALDLKRLRRDAKRLQEKRSKSHSGRATTGATEAIRAALPEIYKLRDQGVLWSEIARALGKQGVVAGKKRLPLTTNGLTARVTQIEQQDRNAAAIKIKKSQSASPSKTNALQKHHLALSEELAADIRTTDGRSPQSEDDLRRSALKRVQRMTRKD